MPEHFCDLGLRVGWVLGAMSSAEEVVGKLTRELGTNEQMFMATKVWTPGSAWEFWKDNETDGIDQMNRSFLPAVPFVREKILF